MDNISLLILCLEYIEVHIKDNITTSDIADACHCSRSTLEKMFRYVYNISIHDYIIRRRMTLAAKLLTSQPDLSILSVAVEYGYNSHEAFTRVFKEIWNCNPSDFRNRKYVELYPKLREPVTKGDNYIMERKSFDISQLYDLFRERRDCWFVCCDIQVLTSINNISRKAGDLAILTALDRMNGASGEDDIAFRIGGDEFCILTNSTDKSYADSIVKDIQSHNNEDFIYDGRKIPLSLHVTATTLDNSSLRYSELFTKLHTAIKDAKADADSK